MMSTFVIHVGDTAKRHIQSERYAKYGLKFVQNIV